MEPRRGYGFGLADCNFASLVRRIETLAVTATPRTLLISTSVTYQNLVPFLSTSCTLHKYSTYNN